MKIDSIFIRKKRSFSSTEWTDENISVLELVLMIRCIT